MRKFIFILIVFLLTTTAIWFWWSFYYTYSDGNRSGMLQKMSHKGNVFKTYEGEMVLNSLLINSTVPVSSEKFYFSVANEILGKKLEQYEGQKIILHYQEKKGILFWRGDSKYIVDSICEVKNANSETIIKPK